jgi:hypothetical protein
MPIDANVRLLRAGSVAGNDAPTLRIDVVEVISDDMDLNEARAIYANEANTLADALFSSLPGGTVDALLAEMLRRKASLCRIPFVDMAED